MFCDVIGLEGRRVVVLDGLVAGQRLSLLAQGLVGGSLLEEVCGSKDVVGGGDGSLVAADGGGVVAEGDIGVAFAGLGAGGQDRLLAVVLLQVRKSLLVVAELQFADTGVG